jgi:DNA polymerase epsilon subunit 2
MFEGYAAAAEYKPMAFVLCGNFAQKGWEGEGGLKRYTSETSHAIACWKRLMG